jgi:hypothetical protein
MDDRLEQELNALLQPLQVEQEASNPPSDDIIVACFSHEADHQDWQRIELHLKALQMQMRERCTLRWTTDEGNPESPSYIGHMARVGERLAKAHIILVGLSVDMQLLLLEQQDLFGTLLSRLEEAKKSSWGQPPYIGGIKMKTTLWDESDLRGIKFIPSYEHLGLDEQSHKDRTCVEITRHVREWISDILDQRSYQATKE